MLGLLLTLQDLWGSMPLAIACIDGNLHEVTTIVIVYTEWRCLPQYSKGYATTLKQRLCQYAPAVASTHLTHVPLQSAV